MKEKILICPDYDFYLMDSEGAAIAPEELDSKDGRLIYLPALDVWAEEMKPVVFASELGQPYDKDWQDYHRRGLALARQLRRILSNDYELWYEAPFEDKSGTVPSSIRIEDELVKKVLFLDFDGVMVTDRYQEQLMATNSPLRDEYRARFDPICVENLRRIIDSTDAEIVVTSTWKMEMGLDGMQRMWEARHLPGRVIGVTPEIDPIHRGNEVQAWLDAYDEGCRYAIIDDCPILDFFREEQLQHLFKVDERTGLDAATAKSVIEHLINKVI